MKKSVIKYKREIRFGAHSLEEKCEDEHVDKLDTTTTHGKVKRRRKKLVYV